MHLKTPWPWFVHCLMVGCHQLIIHYSILYFSVLLDPLPPNIRHRAHYSLRDFGFLDIALNQSILVFLYVWLMQLEQSCGTLSLKYRNSIKLHVEISRFMVIIKDKSEFKHIIPSTGLHVLRSHSKHWPDVSYNFCRNWREPRPFAITARSKPWVIAAMNQATYI